MATALRSTLLIWLSLGIASFAFSNPLLPERIAATDLKEEAYFRAYGQYLQLENGDFTAEKGRVLITQSGEDFELAFYRKDGGEFVRVEGITQFRGTRPPFASALPKPGVPCISAIKKDGSGRLHAFVARGKLSTSESAP